MLKLKGVNPYIGYRIDDSARICEALNYSWPRLRKKYLKSIFEEMKTTLSTKVALGAIHLNAVWDHRLN